MARKFAQFNVTIWNDDDYRALPALAQWLYKVLWTHPSLSYCGVLDWRSGKLAARCADLDAAAVETLADCLEARHFIVRDAETEECLIRSWVRWDGLLNQPRLAVSYANAYADVASSRLRGVVAHEAQKLHEREPDLVGWRNAAVLELLSRPKIDPKVGDQVRDPFGQGLGLASPRFGDGFGPNQGQGLPSVSVPPTPSPAPTPLLPRSRDVGDSPDVRPEVRDLCDLLANEIEGNGSKRPSITKGWTDACRLMIDKDGRTVEEIRGAITWSQADEFWRSNVLSFPTLREKYDRLRLEAGRKRRTGAAGTQQHYDDIFAKAHAWAAEQEASAS